MVLRKTSCKSCGAKIKFIRNRAGRWIPVDDYPVTYKADYNGKDRLVTADGDVIACKSGVDTSEATGIGYVSHFATCPNAATHRRR